MFSIVPKRGQCANGGLIHFVIIYVFYTNMHVLDESIYRYINKKILSKCLKYC